MTVGQPGDHTDEPGFYEEGLQLCPRCGEAHSQEITPAQIFCMIIRRAEDAEDEISGFNQAGRELDGFIRDLEVLSQTHQMNEGHSIRSETKDPQ